MLEKIENHNKPYFLLRIVLQIGVSFSIIYGTERSDLPNMISFVLCLEVPFWILLVSFDATKRRSYTLKVAAHMHTYHIQHMFEIEFLSRIEHAPGIYMAKTMN